MSKSAEDPRWRVGIGVRCITPAKPIILYGYAHPKRFTPSIGVMDDLYAKAVAFEDDGGTLAIIVTVDLCVPRREVSDRLSAAVTQATGIPREQVLINASHTHSGPALDQEDVEGRFDLDDADRQTIADYTESLGPLIADAALQAVGSLAPACLAWGRGAVAFAVNRRQLDENGAWCKMGPNPEGPVDNTVPVMRVTAADGGLRAIVFGLACHNVTLDPNNLLVSGDYAGVARGAIERDHPGATAMYLAGCGADANTEPRGGRRQWVDVRRHGEALGREVGRVLREQTLSFVDGPLRTSLRTLEMPLEWDLSREELERRAAGPEWQGLNAKNALAALDRGENLPRTYSTLVSLWRFGSTLDLFGLPGETASGYAEHAYNLLADRPTWACGYCHDVFGYLPTAQIIAEGGYETRGLLPPALGTFAPAVEDAVTNSMRQMVREL